MPVEPSASAHRVVAVLTYLAGSDQELNLTDIASATDMNKTTCQSVLIALTDSGYVIRDDERKTYQLGPAVLALVTSTGIHQEVLARAQIALEAISAEFDVETTATVATQKSIVKVAHVPRRRLHGIALRPGQAVPLARPLGAAHVAWSSPQAMSDWIERSGISARSAAGRRALTDLATVRARGFSATSRRVHRAATSHDAVDRPDAQVVDINRSARRVFQLAAPVFGPDGRVLLVIGILEHDETEASTIRQHVNRLLDAAATTTIAIGGVVPVDAKARRTARR